MRLPLIITGPASAQASVRVFSDDAGTTEATIYTSTTSAASEQPYACAAATDTTLYVSAPQVVWVSAKVAGVEMAGGYGALRRCEIEGGLTRVAVAEPPVSAAANRSLEDGPPSADTASVWTVAITGSPAGGTFTLDVSVADLEGGPTQTATTTALAHDASNADVGAAVQVAIEALGYDNVDITVGVSDLTFTHPPVVTLALNDNSLTGGTDPSVTTTEDTPGVLGSGRLHPQGYEWVDVTNSDIYTNFGGTGLDRAGLGDAPNWVQTYGA